MGFYNLALLPGLTNWVYSQNNFTSQRKKVVPKAKGKVLEIGIGSGLNLPFYAAENIDHLWGLDPSGRLKKMAEKKAAALRLSLDFIGLSGEQIPLENHSADTVVVTYTLCSIPDVGKALMEMHRVLKPGGELIFCEHGKAQEKSVQSWQDRLNPLWKCVSGGCNLNRPIPDLIEKAGFKIKTLEKGYISNFKLAGFNYWGSAVHQ